MVNGKLGTNKTYFRNLDGFRAIAATFVIIGHCQTWIHEHSPTPILVFDPWGHKLAGFGVDFFFVLSGFLISFILFTELEKTNAISIKRFYQRRILRLWPLYFVFGITTIVFGTFLSHLIGFEGAPQSRETMLGNLLYLCTFTTNFQTMNHTANDYSAFFLGHFWSLGVEEQFYLIFAPLVLFCKNRIQILLLSFIAIGYFLTAWHFNFYDDYTMFTYNFTLNRFFHFGLGALLSYWFVKKKFRTIYQLSIFENYALQLCFLIPMWIFMFGRYYQFKPDLDRIVQGLISAGLILTGISRFSILPFELAPLKYLGKISFGIYIFHLVSMRVVAHFLQSMSISVDNFYFILLFPILTFILSVFFASLSYRFLESPFLKLKSKL